MIEAWLALLFGLLIGSFLNVCVYRWPRDLSVVRPRSHCVACGKTIAWYDNIPVVSFFLLGARCRHCKVRISWRYPVVELATGVLFFYFVSNLGVTLAAVKMCVFSALLVALTFSDLEERILPDELTKGGIAAGLLFAVFVPVPEGFAQFLVSGRAAWILESALGALIPALILWLAGWLYQLIRHREGLGLGDIKLIAMVGSFLGLRGALLTLAVGSLAGSVIGYSYIRLAGKDAHTYELPLGTFLALTALAIGMAPGILSWYGGL